MTSTTKRYCFKVSRVFIYIVSLIFPTSLWNSWRISKLQKTLWLREVTQLSKDYTTQYVVVWPLNHLWLSCDPKHCSSPGPSVHGVSQARTLEWVAISFSMGSFRPRDGTHVSCIGMGILYHWATWECCTILHRGTLTKIQTFGVYFMYMHTTMLSLCSILASLQKKTTE